MTGSDNDRPHDDHTSARDTSAHDARISAWIDGVMDPAEAARFEAEMDADPALAEQVLAWQDNDDLLRAAFSAPIDEGVDDALLVRMGLAPRAATTAEVIELGVAPQSVAANDNSPVKHWIWPGAGAVAAALALFVAVHGAGPAGNDGLTAALDGTPSHSEVALADGGRLTPVLTFAAADGRFCREFTVQGGKAPGGGIACRKQGAWQVEQRTAAGAALPDDQRVVTAGGPDGAGLDATYARLGASDPLTSQAEQALIANGWKNSGH